MKFEAELIEGSTDLPVDSFNQVHANKDWY